MSSENKKRRNPRQRSTKSQSKAHPQSKADKKSGATKKTDKARKQTVYPMNFAGPMRRLYAFTIDFGLIMMIIYAVAPAANGVMFNQEAAPQDLIFFFGYFIIPTIIWGRTPGKWVAGIVVVDSAILARMPERLRNCLLYTSPSPRDLSTSRMPSSA